MKQQHFYAGDNQQGKEIRRLAIAAVTIIAVALCCRPLFAEEPLPDLRDLSLKGWDCLAKREGTPYDAAGAARNRMKNRDWIAVTATNIPQWDYAQFVEHTHAFDAELGEVKARAALTPEATAKLAAIETQVVSVTGWLVLTYPGPPESCNCDSAEYHDWHIELVPKPLDHAPRIGDPTALICEVTPRVESAIYKSGVRLVKLAEFMNLGKPPNIVAHPTGTAPHKVRITGYLMWDDQHNEPDKDFGATIARGGSGEYHHPWRETAWEVHPLLKIEDLGTAH
jgi:hypothetical protein